MHAVLTLTLPAAGLYWRQRSAVPGVLPSSAGRVHCDKVLISAWSIFSANSVMKLTRLKACCTVTHAITNAVTGIQLSGAWTTHKLPTRSGGIAMTESCTQRCQVKTPKAFFQPHRFLQHRCFSSPVSVIKQLHL